MSKKLKSGVFRPFKGIYRNEKGEVVVTDEFYEDIARRKISYEQWERRLEQAKLAKKEEQLARKKDIVAQLKDAQLEIEMNILHSLISKDIVLFAYNYYRSVLCMHASEELDLETL